MKKIIGWLLAAPGLLLLQETDALALDRVHQATGQHAQALQADALGSTASGASYITPAGWIAETSPRATIMSVPGQDARIAILDVEADTADQALAVAWDRYRPQAELQPRTSREVRLRNGWSFIRTYLYEDPQGQDRYLRAQVLNDGKSWTVVIMDLAAESMQLRAPQVTRVLTSLRTEDYVPETLADRSAQDLDGGRIAALVDFLEQARTGLGIPGIALGVVQNGEVKYAGGVGIRKLGSEDKVDASTRFLTASVTKPMTSLMLAKLVDMGKLDWDAPVARLLPGFQVGDAGLTGRIHVRHLLCACTGIPAQDMEWVFSGDRMDPEDVLEVLAGVEPTAGIGELYQYSNLMVAAGGYLGGHVLHRDLPLGQAYDRAMQELVFDPIGMASTTFDFDTAQRGNYASPHATTIDGETVVSSMGYNLMSIPMRPDGGAWSSVDDLLRYLQVELSSGRLADGRRYIGVEAMRERLEGQVARGGVDQWYGMGLKTDRRLGILQVTHGGSMAGYQAEVLWLPEIDVGYVLLMNADAGVNLREVFGDRFLEVVFDIDRGAAAALAALPSRLAGEQAERRSGLVLPLSREILQELAPAYSHPTLGEVQIVREGARTWLDFGGWRTEVASATSGDRTVLESISPGVAGFRFGVSTNVDGSRALILEDGRRTYTFREATPARSPGGSGGVARLR